MKPSAQGRWTVGQLGDDDDAAFERRNRRFAAAQSMQQRDSDDVQLVSSPGVLTDW